MRAAIRLLLSLVLPLTLLAACSTVGGWFGFGGPPKTALKKLWVVADADANQTSATRLDLVLVYQQTAIDQLPKTAPLWFAGKAALLDGMPGAFEVVSLELPPATKLEPIPMPENLSKALAVYAYADHSQEAGQHRAVLTPLKQVQIQLRARDVRYLAVQP